jgi:hypothetical protein
MIEANAGSQCNDLLSLIVLVSYLNNCVSNFFSDCGCATGFGQPSNMNKRHFVVWMDIKLLSHCIQLMSVDEFDDERWRQF